MNDIDIYVLLGVNILLKSPLKTPVSGFGLRAFSIAFSAVWQTMLDLLATGSFESPKLRLGP